MAAQLVGRLVAAHGRAKPAARGKGKTAAWRAELEALAATKRAQAVAFKAGPAPPPRLLAAVARSGTVGPGELGEL